MELLLSVLESNFLFLKPLSVVREPGRAEITPIFVDEM
jgi:hypothetical protein